MKKLLFTLAALLTAGISYAGMPVLAFDVDEINLAAGESQTINVLIAQDAGQTVMGGQFQVYVPDGFTIEYVNLGTPRQPNWQYFRPGVVMTDGGTPVSSSNPEPGYYRIMVVNTSTNCILQGDEVEYYGGEGVDPVLFSFNLIANEDYDGSPATIALVDTETFENKWSMNETENYYPLQEGNTISFEVNPEEVGPTVAPDPVISFVENADGSVTVNVDPYTSVAIHVNGYEENYYTAPVTIQQGYTDKVITVEAINAPENMEPSQTVNKEYTLTAKEKETAAKPTYTTEVTATTVIITVVPDPNTDGELVILDEDGNEVKTNPIVVNRGATDATYTFTAYTEEGDTYKQSPLLNGEVNIPALEVSAAPTVEVTEDGQCVIITVTGDNVTLVVDGYETYEDEDGSLYVIIPKKEEDGNWTVTYTATNQEGDKQPTTVTNEVTIKPADKAASVAPEFRMETYDTYCLIYAYVDAKAGTVVMYDEYGVEPIDNPVRVNRPAYGEDAIYYTAVAGNTDEGWYKETRNSEVFKIPAQEAKVYDTPAPTVTAEQDDNNMVITATGEGTVTLYVTVYDPETGAPTTYTVEGEGEASYSIARGDEDVMISYYATAEATEVPAGYDELGEAGATQAVTDWVDKKEQVTPPTPTEKADAPNSSKENYVYQDGNVYYNAYTVTLTQPENSEDTNYEIYYRIGVLQEDGTYLYPEEWTLYTGPFNKAEEGTYMVEAYATADNKLESDHIFDGFTVSVATSIEELFAGENVASVRFFNVAGQEMQEVNGLTIVVTTYTNGTQSAVKVIK